MPATIRTPVRLFVYASVAMLAGCASPGSRGPTANAITIERVDSSRAEVTSARVTRGDATITVSGRLQKRHRGRSLIPGHLHIEVLDADGLVLAEATTGYRRLSPKMGLSEFSQSLPVEGDHARTIRVSHHDDHGSDDA